MNIPQKTLALIAAGAASIAILHSYIDDKEGLSLSAYEDIVGVLTVCRGHTDDVQRGIKYTEEQCNEIDNKEEVKYIDFVKETLPVPLSNAQVAGLSSFAYNVGMTAAKNSTAFRLIKQGNIEDGCNALLKFKFAGGKDCSIHSNKCYGIWDRRLGEKQLCLMADK